MARYSDEFPLHQAAASLDLTGIRRLLTEGFKVDSRTRHFETPLMVAAEKKEGLPIIQALIAAGADVNAQDRASQVHEGKRTALHRAVSYGFFETAKALLEAGAVADMSSQSGATPLIAACYNGSLRFVRLLLDHGGNPSGIAKSQVPLAAVATASTVALVEKRSRPQKEFVEVARELLKRGANPDESRHDGTALHHAIHLPLVRELLAAGADVNARADGGVTPLLTWALAGPYELLRSLVEAGAEVNVMSEGGESPMLRLWGRTPPDVAVLKMYVNAGGDVNQTDPQGRTLLDNFAQRMEEIERGRTSDPLRAKYCDDYVEERRALIDFLIGTGAIHKGKTAKPKSVSANRIQRFQQ